MKFSLSKHFTTASAFRTQRSLNALAVLLFVVALFPLRIHAQIDAEMVTNMGRNALSVDDYLTAIRSTPSLLKCINCVAFVVSMLTTFKGR